MTLLGNHWKMWKMIRRLHMFRCLFCGTHHVSQRRKHSHNAAKNITAVQTAPNINHIASCHLWLSSNTRQKKEVTRNLYGAPLQGQMTETSFICYWMCTSWVLERCAPQFENHWTNLWMAWSTYYGVDEWRLKMWNVAWRTEIWRGLLDSVRDIVNMSYKGRWQRVGGTVTV